jgi:TonB family protein
MKPHWRWVLVAALVATRPSPGRADDALEAARRLYAAAAYEDALKTLEGLGPARGDATSSIAVEQQRVLCLVALGRPADAEQAMTAMVQADPLYLPDAASAPPRVRAAFRDVRAKLVPAIAKNEYERARQAYESADYDTATSGFDRVLSIVQLSDGGSEDPVLRDIAVLAAGFKALSGKANDAARAATAAPAPAPAPGPPAVVSPAMPPPVRIYDASSRGVEGPTTIRQEMPQWPHALGPPPNRDAVLAIVINEEGLVEAARVMQSAHRRYDQILLTAASTWSYTPAQIEGRRVKFRKVLKLSFK